MYCHPIIDAGQICFESVSVHQRGSDRFSSPRQVIVPRANFTCNGRITSVSVSMNRVNSGTSDPYLEVWHPQSPGIGVFDKVGEIQLIDNVVAQVGTGSPYWNLNVSIIESDRIEFEVGDVIGYYQPPDSRYQMWTIRTSGYTAYDTPTPSNTSNLVTLNINRVDRQPLILLTTGLCKMHFNILICLLCTLFIDYNYVHEENMVHSHSATKSPLLE